MDIKNLRIFVRVAARENLSSVAQEMNVAAATISKRIQALEDDLGVRLVDRTTRSSRLTEEGRKFLTHAERVLQEMDIARDEISESAGQPAGRISISAPQCLAEELIDPAMIGFVKAYPSIDVRIDITDQIANLHEEGYDAAIRSGTLSDSSLKAKRLACDRIILVASPAYIAEHGAPQRPSDLQRHHCLVQGDNRIWTIKSGEDAENVRVSSRLSSDNGQFLRKAARQGLGILKTSELAVASDIASGELLQVMADHELASDAGIWVVYPNNKHELPRLRVFLDYLADYFKENGYTAARRAGLNQPPPYAKGPSDDSSRSPGSHFDRDKHNGRA